MPDYSQMDTPDLLAEAERLLERSPMDRIARMTLLIPALVKRLRELERSSQQAADSYQSLGEESYDYTNKLESRIDELEQRVGELERLKEEAELLAHAAAVVVSSQFGGTDPEECPLCVRLLDGNIDSTRKVLAEVDAASKATLAEDAAKGETR